MFLAVYNGDKFSKTVFTCRWLWRLYSLVNLCYLHSNTVPVSFPYLSIFTDLAAEKTQLWWNRNFRNNARLTGVSKIDEKLNLGSTVSKRKGKAIYSNWNDWMQQAAHIARKMLASLLSLIAKGLNQTPTCKNWLILLTDSLFQKNWHNKIPVGATWEHRPHNFLAVGAIAPIAPMPWSRRLCLVTATCSQ